MKTVPASGDCIAVAVGRQHGAAEVDGVQLGEYAVLAHRHALPLKMMRLRWLTLWGVSWECRAKVAGAKLAIILDRH